MFGGILICHLARRTLVAGSQSCGWQRLSSCGVTGTFAAAQDQPAPKWELYGGYSFFDPATDVHGLLPGGLLPASSRIESNPHGIGGSVTYNFNRWFGLTADGSGHWGSGENGVAWPN